MGFWLNKIRTNREEQKVDKKYYTSDTDFQSAKEKTKNTPAIFGEEVVVNVTNNNATARDLQARDILAKYISGVSGYHSILGSAMEDAFIKANADDFTANGTLERNGKEYNNYSFNADTSDGNITMPTLQSYTHKNGTVEEFYVIGDRTFNADGTVYASKMDQEYIIGRYGEYSAEGQTMLRQLEQEGRFDE